jgi:hypothetical protein
MPSSNIDLVDDEISKVQRSRTNLDHLVSEITRIRNKDLRGCAGCINHNHGTIPR